MLKYFKNKGVQVYRIMQAGLSELYSYQLWSGKILYIRYKVRQGGRFCKT